MLTASKLAETPRNRLRTRRMSPSSSAASAESPWAKIVMSLQEWAAADVQFAMALHSPIGNMYVQNCSTKR